MNPREALDERPSQHARFQAKPSAASPTAVSCGRMPMSMGAGSGYGGGTLRCHQPGGRGDPRSCRVPDGRRDRPCDRCGERRLPLMVEHAAAGAIGRSDALARRDPRRAGGPRSPDDARTGQALAEARSEIDYAASFVAFYAEEAKRVSVEGVASHLPDADMRLTRRPVGVAGLVTPWNFPSAMLTRKAAAALAAGCTTVAHPSAYTPCLRWRSPRLPAVPVSRPACSMW